MTLGTAARAQFTAPATSSESMLPKVSVDRSSLPPTSAEGMTFESPVNPKEYHLGPGDVLECRFWTSGQAYYPQVSSDNMLLIPNLGAFNTADKTFAEIQAEVLQKASESFSSRTIKSDNPLLSLTIYQPRKIFVTVEGDVASPGVYTLSAAMRADVAVDLANQKPTTSSQPLDVATEQREQLEAPAKKRLEAVFGTREVAAPSERYITVAHDDGTTSRVDLVRYGALHDPTAAPPLREGDVIDVPFRDPRRPSIGVYGAVQSPGDFEYVQGDSLSSAVRYAFGPSANADLHHVEVSRAAQAGAPDPILTYDLTAIEAHTAPDIALEPNDRIILRSLPEEHNAAVVIVRGQVADPGVYPITNGTTTLSEIVHDAGGLTPAAYPAGGVLLRHGYYEQLTEGTPEEVSQVTRLENLGVSDTSNFQRQMAMRPPNVTVDMDAVLVHNDHAADVALQDGDEIDIPTQPTTVYVCGFVNNAGLVNYQKGAPLRYYISQAGGYANGADDGKTAIIKLRTKAWMEPGDTTIEPGDQIFVPKVPDLPENYEEQNLATLTGLVVGVASFLVSMYLTFIKKP